MDNKFQLNHAVNKLVASISAMGTVTIEDEKELSTHLFETVETLTKKGLSEEEAFEVAKLRLGKKEELAIEFQKVNGINMLNKEWVFIFIGIGLAVISNTILRAFELYIANQSLKENITEDFAAILLSFVYIFLVIVTISIFKKGDRLSVYFKRIVFDNNNWLIGLFATLVGLLTLIPIHYLLFGNIETSQIEQELINITYGNRKTEFIIRGTIPTILILSIFLSSQSVNKKLGWHTLFYSNNYLYIFLFSVAIEGVASMCSRQLFFGSWFAPVIYSLIFTISIVVFIFYNQKSLLLKTVCFAAFPFTTELFISIYKGHGNWSSSSLFGFGISVIISVLLGFSIGFWVKKTKAIS